MHPAEPIPRPVPTPDPGVSPSGQPPSGDFLAELRSQIDQLIEAPGAVEDRRAALHRLIDQLEAERFGTARGGRLFRAVFDQAFQLISILTTDGLVLEANQTGVDLVGADRRDVVFKSFWETPWWCHSREEQERIRDAIRRAANGEAVRMEATHLGTDGGLHTLDFWIKPVHDESGKVVLLVAEGRDVTPLLRAEQVRREIEDRQDAILQTMPVILYRTEVPSPYAAVWMTANAQRITGYPVGDFLTRPHFWNERLHPEDRERVSTAFAGAGTGQGIEIEYRWRCADGSYRWFFDRVVSVAARVGRPVECSGIWLDIDERKQLEERLRQAQKMQAVGQLAGGVAHDFNNLLTVISGNCELLRGMATPETERDALLGQIRHAAGRATELTRQLLAFSRRQVLRMQDLDLNVLVAGLTELLRRLIGEDIVLEASYDPRGVPVQADPGMMEQILLNLAVNARDAMPRGGRLCLSTTTVRFPAEDDSPSPHGREGDFVRLRVEDTGEGIEAEHLPRIFEPFFTTKPVGKGTGLGLATVFGIVEQHRGWIAVHSVPGRGTVFDVFLARRESGGVTDRVRPSRMTRGGSETILVVEDDDGVRDLARRILVRQGYRVLEAATPDAALRVWDEQRHSIDLVFTDVVMPGGMNGIELARRLLAERPDLKVIYASAYSREMLESRFAVSGRLGFLGKPYSTTQLSQAIRATLDEERAGGG